MTKSEYAQYLKSVHWEKIKEEYKKSDLFTGKCYTCEKDLKTCHFHHQTYKRLGNERLTDIISICSKCHYYIHKLLFSNTKLNLWGATNFIRKKRGLKGINRKRKNVKYKTIPKQYKNVIINGKNRRIPIYKKVRAY